MGNTTPDPSTAPVGLTAPRVPVGPTTIVTVGTVIVGAVGAVYAATQERTAESISAAIVAIFGVLALTGSRTLQAIALTRAIGQQVFANNTLEFAAPPIAGQVGRSDVYSAWLERGDELAGVDHAEEMIASRPTVQPNVPDVDDQSTAKAATEGGAA